MRIWGFEDFFNKGRQVFEHKYVPLTLISCIKSYLFIGKDSLLNKFIALALFIRMSIEPNSLIILSIAFSTWSSNLISVLIGKALTPNSSISLAAIELINKFNDKNIIGAGFIINLPKLKGEQKLKSKGIAIHSLMEF